MSEAAEYFESQRDWSRDTLASDRKSKRLAWTIALISLALVGLQALLLLYLLPLKTTETVTLLVDRTSGFTQVLDSQGEVSIRSDEALRQSLLAQYVVSRERLAPELINQDYRKTALWSSGAARQAYVANMTRENADSPLRDLNEATKTYIDIKSVSQISPGQALVRFDTFRNVGAGRERVASWISAIGYEFVDGPMGFEDRLLNPLGFQVTSYRRDQESPVSVEDPEARPVNFAPDTLISPSFEDQPESEWVE